MFRIAVCDDEKCFCETVKKYVGNYLIKKEIPFEIDTFGSGKDLIALGPDIVKYTIVFLDVNMEEINGIKTAQKIREYSSEIYIVFVTAYIDYSLEGYKVNAERYILKNNINLEDSIFECMDSIFAKLKYFVFKRKFVFIECERNISLEKIVYIESKLHKLEFHVIEECMMTYSLYGTLNSLEKELLEFGFLRIHQSFLVNLRHIKKVTGYHAILNNGQMLPIPKTRYRVVKNAFIAYIGEL
ncbi:MAG: LytTR family DNA-binding domain-containing protein [Lachnospiraceae bacterium]|nr:LytTR family DNA-binding domain-containing protein [Lachnospiraceae bacterium]